MTTEAPTPLEDRIRQGLRRSSDALPPRGGPAPTLAPAPVPAPARRDRHGGRRAPRHWSLAAAALTAVAAVTAAVAVAVVATGGDGDGGPDDVRAAAPAETTVPATPTTVVPQPTNGLSPGRVVVDPVAAVVHTYDEAGAETGRVSLAPLEGVQSVVSDLDGGYVACGLVPGDPLPPEVLEADPEAIPGWRDELRWFPADGPSQVIDTDDVPVPCVSDSLQVVDSSQGAMVVLSPGFPPDTTWRGYVIATGELVPLAPSVGGFPGYWAAATGRIAAYVDGTGLAVYDLATGEQATPPIAVPGAPSAVRLAPDGSSVAMLTGPVMGPLSLDVYDTATGEVTLHETFDTSAEGDQLSYDGRTVAVGSYYADRMPVTVIDIETGARRTLDASGLLL